MYTSTRKRINVDSATAIINGIASDGGLYILDNWPRVNLSKEDANLSYHQVLERVLQYFLDGFNDDEILQLVIKQYKNFSDKIVGLDKIDNFYQLSLYHGPTFAFKDMALSMFSDLQTLAKAKQNDYRKSIILTATSGDTGSACLSGFVGDKDTDVIVLYPYQKISEFQEAQMLGFVDENKHVIAIEGNFDDCQNIVKRVFREVRLNNKVLSSANSINIARIIPQVVYYIYSYLLLVRQKEISFGDKINYSVPTGNFGNVLAAYFAKKMGLPINKLIVASNQNNVLTDFFNKGIYDRNRVFHKTISPSMDILVSSNLERLLYLVSNEDYVCKQMEALRIKGCYTISDDIKDKLNDFHAEFVSEKEAKQTILDIFAQGFLIDPHTAVAVKAYQKYNDPLPTIVVSTANPFKFSDSLLKVFGEKVFSKPFENINRLQEITNKKADPRMIDVCKQQNKRIVWRQDDIEKLKKLIGEIDDKN